MKKRGISLIVLIVTIIVIIILAAVVILTLSKNNPIESAKETAFKEDVRTFQDELAMHIAKDYTNKAGQRDEKITATNYNPAGDPASVYTYISSFSKKYEGKFVIKNDELMYKEGELTESEQIWSKDLNVKLNQKTGAEKAKEDPQNYYGAKVDYKTGNEDIDNDIKEWKIFYSDGSNIYLITSEYVDPITKLPSVDGVKPTQGDATNYPKAALFRNIVLKYIGSEDITDNKIKEFNSDYFDKNYTSESNNMRSVAYMLDKDIWSNFVNTSVAEYSVGGPSVEMFLKSYCEKYTEYKDEYIAEAKNSTGYQISKDGGTSWVNSISRMLNTSDDLYVLSQNKGASAMWLASPSNSDSACVMHVNSDGSINYSYFNYPHNVGGFRPLVCLNSNILLKWNEQDRIFEIE